MGQSFLGKFFGKRSDTNALSVQQSKELQDTLQNQYGITISANTLAVSDLLASGYRRMHSDEIASVNSIFQFVPQVVSTHANMRNVQQTFDSAVKGTYRVRLAPGTHLAQSHATPGAFRGVGLDNVTNKVGSGNPELFVNDATLKVSSAPQIALNVFNAASFVTGQYFMAQVNSKLASITDSVNRVERYLEASDRSKLIAAAQELQDIANKLDFIEKDQSRVVSSIEQIHAIQRQCQETINLSRELALTDANNANKKDAEKEIQRKLSAIGMRMVQYHYAVLLYTSATLIEIKLSKVFDPDDLEVFRLQMQARVDQFKTDFAICDQSIARYLNENQVLNDRKWWEIALSATAENGGFAAGPIGSILAVLFGEKAGKTVDSFFDGKRQQKKDTYVSTAQAITKSISDLKAIEAPVHSVSMCIDTFRKDIDFIQIGEEYYTNIPDSTEFARTQSLND